MSACPTLRISDRVRFLAPTMALLFLMGWGAWFWPFDDCLDRQGTPLGADFSMFYVAGQVAADGDFQKLYDQAEHQRRLHDLFPRLAPQFCLPYRYPPAVALAMAPLSRIPYPVAWILFTFASCIAWASAIWLLQSAWSRPGPETVTAGGAGWHSAAVWASVGWPVALEVLIGGQASMLGLLIAVASCLLLQRNQHVAAGAVLALSAYKPNLLALFAMGVAVRHPRVVLGAVPVLAVFVCLSGIAGWDVLAEFFSLTTQLAAHSWGVETPYWKVHSLATWFDFLAPGGGKLLSLFVGVLAAVTIGAWWQWRDRVGSLHPLTTRNLKQCAAMLLVVNALFNPYTPIYDLVLLSAAAWLATEAFQSSATGRNPISPLVAQALLAMLYFGPHLSQSLARPLGFQLFPLVLAMVLLGVAWQWCGVGSQMVHKAG